MSQSIYSLLNAIVSVLDGGWIFIITLSLEFIAFTAVLFLTLFKPLYTLFKRIWFFIICFILLSLELAFLRLDGAGVFFYISLSFTGILSLVILLLPIREIKVSNHQRSLARFIDNQIKREEPPSPFETLPPIKTQKQQEKQVVNSDNSAENVKRFELDFQHVKLVVQKLEYYPLSTTDKKIVKELEESIALAEQGEFSTQIKCKINDGLGALLKIMSKYGV